MPQNPTDGPDVLIGDPTRIDNLEGLGGDDFLLLPRNKRGVQTITPEFMNGGEGDDTLISYAWVIALGGAGNDQIIGSSSDDIIDGEEGDDFVFGGDGNDELVGGSGNDTVSYNGSGHDGVIVDLLNGTASSGGYVDTLSGFENVEGSKGPDIILGDDHDNTIHGLGGADAINGRGGRDVIYGDGGNDTIAGEDGDDFLYGGNGHDSLVGGDGIDQLYGENGNDFLNGGAGSDILDGGKGARDTAAFIDSPARVVVDLAEGTATTVLPGGAMEVDALRNIEDILGSNFPDMLWGDDNDNVINGADGADFIDGRGGNDILIGANDPDVIRGGDGNDILFGQDGNDHLSGGPGADILSGGPSGQPEEGFVDTFEFNNNDFPLTDIQKTDTIIDFTLGVDRLFFNFGFFDDNDAARAAINDYLSVTPDVTGDNTIIQADLTGTPAAEGAPAYTADVAVLLDINFENVNLENMLAAGDLLIA